MPDYTFYGAMTRFNMLIWAILAKGGLSLVIPHKNKSGSRPLKFFENFRKIY
jgi:hypothetical protein